MVALAAAPQGKVPNKSSSDWNVERNTKVTLIRKDAVEQEITGALGEAVRKRG